jgi:catechol 2,3-dioxygenase-like lactoylglutathione lyase family enzyme
VISRSWGGGDADGVTLWLRPSDARGGSVDGEQLAGSRLGEHLLWALRLGRHHEERPPVGAAEGAREAAAIELDRLQHLASFADADAALVRDVAVPDRTLFSDVRRNNVDHQSLPTTIRVLDQDEALAFYTEKLGFEVNKDATMDDFRWLTVSAPDRPDHELILLVPGPPMMDEESAQQVKELVAKGVLGAGAFETDDCRATYAELSARGVSFLSEPAERFYGVDATFRDNSGNWFSMTQRTEMPVAK